MPVDFEGANKGPSVTQYLIRPGYVERKVRGETKRIKVKVNKITTLANDLALALAAPSVRIEAPIPGTNYVGVEVPNSESNKVGLKDLMESDEYAKRKGNLIIALGEDVKGKPIVTDLTRMPHLLIAGATGSGKSVCINSIIISLLLTHTPDTLRMLMIDPKMVELSVYNGIPHLLAPVVTEVDKASGILFWAVKEMERRYSLLSKVGARDLARYNSYLEKRGEKRLPFIVVVVDEMADLMMAAPEEVEKHICRLAQMARAVGIHLIIATQRPSVDVITGLIKANFPGAHRLCRHQPDRQPRHPRRSRRRTAAGRGRHALHGAGRQQAGTAAGHLSDRGRDQPRGPLLEGRAQLRGPGTGPPKQHRLSG